ncbi:methionyl-tRNA formyltransferase [Pontiella agarivorans]|uniref:Methionyl-tRNA formyltransferase n=1 Tax=Pontiella agarivorans TaxID=3038953 RepID=A0ABU5N1M9_9BACT|nr:methionyl-tRNA formyltransferase [Pontiella agarivorans]MDZ8120362.1 methionyl-tRNA formyltransferase [Pontiella agarivorans]
MRIVFMGSAALAVPSLKAILHSGQDDVVGVVSQPDRPAGRKRILTPCPLKAYADEQGLNILTPEKIGDPDAVQTLEQLKPDLLVVVAYGQYIPQRVIRLATHEAINVHPSLLPKYRGSAPIQWAILNGDQETGVSIIYLAEKMDAGDILRQETYPLDGNETSGILHDKLAVVGANLLIKAIDDIRQGSVSRVIQNESEMVEVRKLTKDDGRIDWSLSADQIRNRIRAFDPWPGSFCRMPGGDLLKIWSADVEEGRGEKPGTLLDEQLLVQAGDGALRLREVQPPGKKRMPAKSFLNGFTLVKGEILD